MKELNSLYTEELMDPDFAESIAREYLAKNIQFTFHKEQPADTAFYNFDPADNYLFSFKLGGQQTLGGKDYIAVSKCSGKVHYLGFYGE